MFNRINYDTPAIAIAGGIQTTKDKDAYAAILHQLHSGASRERFLAVCDEWENEAAKEFPAFLQALEAGEWEIERELLKQLVEKIEYWRQCGGGGN